MVFSKSGGAEFVAMASTAARSSASAAVNAGEKSDGVTVSHGGTPLYGPGQGRVSGFVESMTATLSDRPRGCMGGCTERPPALHGV